MRYVIARGQAGKLQMEGLFLGSDDKLSRIFVLTLGVMVNDSVG